MRNTLLGVMMSIALLPSLSLAQKNTQHLEEKLKKAYPQLTIDEIAASPIDGLYQVTASGNVVYITKEGRYLLVGELLDLDDKQNNLTENARKKSRLKSLQSISEDKMIIFPAKKPEYTITVFTDVDCGYCKKMQNDMAKINDLGISVRYLAFPRTGTNSPTGEKMIKIWCAKDKKQAFHNANEGKEPEGSICPNNSVTAGYELGAAIGINGTPTMVFEDGTFFPGYLPPEKILEAAKQIREQSKK